MIVIPPITINDTTLTSTTVSEPSTGEVVWNSTTNYATDDIVIRTSTHRKYQRITPGGIDATAPESAPTKWQDIGPTNAWAMFDQNRNVATVSPAGTMTVVIEPNKRIDSLGLIGVNADTVTVTMEAPVGTVVFGPTEYSMNTRNTTTWSTYFFGTFLYKETLLITSFPMYANSTVTIEFANDTDDIQCSGVILGSSVYLGAVQYDAVSDALNFSKIERDEFGNSELIPRRTVPKTQQSLWVDKSLVNSVRQVRKDLNAIPALWSGLDDQFTDPYFESILIFGIYKQFEINIAQPSVATISLELEEL